MFFLITAVRVLSLAGSHSPPHLPRGPSNTVLVWTCSGGSSDSNPVLLLCVLDSNVHSCQNIDSNVHSCLLLWELSMTFYIFNRHRVCLVDHLDLICSFMAD